MRQMLQGYIQKNQEPKQNRRVAKLGSTPWKFDSTKQNHQQWLLDVKRVDMLPATINHKSQVRTRNL